MFLAVGMIIALLGVIRLLVAALLEDADLRRIGWLWIATGVLAGIAQI